MTEATSFRDEQRLSVKDDLKTEENRRCETRVKNDEDDSLKLEAKGKRWG
jgi:hypothetical protein